ncbi:MAG: EAL domain-containing protein [Gammaproteobacteria bacterium]|nr:EAL domain-containing protein [Gammaproteobacteria bacterium]
MEKILLLVDDQRSILLALKRVFRGTDYHVLTAEDGQSALEIIRETPVSVLLSDYNMPGISGAELLSEARQIRPEMSRLILSGNSDQDSVIKSINDGGALKFLCKPWDSEKLIAEIDDAFKIWEEKRFSQDISVLLNQASFLKELQNAVDSNPRSDFAVLSMQIRDYQSIQQVLKLHQEKEFLNHYFSLRKNDQAADTVLGLMNDGRFCAMVSVTPQHNDALQAINQLLDGFSDEVSYEGKSFQMRFDAGYALPSDTDLAAEELLRCASTALDHAISEGKEGCRAFDSKMHESAMRRIEIAECLATALQNNEFSLCYQPKINSSEGTLHGAEALIRWNNPKLGVISPFHFIPLAEESDLIIDIGQWVMDTAADQWKKWVEAESTHARVSVNVSARQLKDRKFASRVASVIDRVGLEPSALELEITESLMMQDINAAIAVLEELKELGIKLSIDDFGTGYSSLNYLHKLPLDVMKIDRSFILPILERKESQALVRNLIVMAQDLGMEIVAEGIEDQEQLDMLQKLGCDVIQGYFYSPPVPAEEFEVLMGSYPLEMSPEVTMVDAGLRKAV